MTSHYPAARQNLDAARIIDQAISMAPLAGRREAAAFLEQSGISFAVIVRVLSGTTACKRRVPADQIASNSGENNA